MFNKLLLALDGSETAEAARPYVGELALAAGSEEVVLLSVVETTVKGELHAVESYLHEGAGVLRKNWDKNLDTAPHVECVCIAGKAGQAAGEIIEFAQDHDISLIVMSTRGRSGIDRWLVGSVAEKVVRAADAPVFLVRASAIDKGSRPTLGRILIPLDGSELAEQALPYAEFLADAGSCQLVLLHVEPPRSRGSRSDRDRRGTINEYLSTIGDGLARSGIDVAMRVRSGHPAEQVEAAIEEDQIDMVLMSSHGRSGLARLAFGSVADQILHTSTTPVMLIRAKVDGEVPEHLQGHSAHHCQKCWRRTSKEVVTSNDLCLNCQSFLKTCANCHNFDEVACLLQLPHIRDAIPGNRCPEFQFRKSRMILR